jgi:hypothetical protein
LPRIARLLLVAFMESFAASCVQRAIFFFCQDQLGFSNAANLALALGFGVAYVAGALASHRASLAVGGKRVMAGAIAAQMLAHLVLAGWPVTETVVVCTVALGLFNGLKWPLIESYISGGRSAADTARAIGRFNIAWATAVPLTLLVAGPIIHLWPRGLFILPAALNAAALWLIAPLPARPPRLPEGHPHRLPPGQLRYLGSLLSSSRWSMLTSYAALWILAAMAPGIFNGLGVGVAWATGLAGLVDVARLTAFVVLERWHPWHGRRWPLVCVIPALPAGLFIVLFGKSLGVVLAGEVLFGLAAGMTYYAALYYAMVVKNASVDAGGAHEGLIGAGFALGPAAGLAGIALKPALGSKVLGTIAGIGPLFALCAVGAAIALAEAGNGPQADP